MPRPGPRRGNTAVRMSEEQVKALDRLAELDGVNRSDEIRRAVDEMIERRKGEL